MAPLLGGLSLWFLFLRFWDDEDAEVEKNWSHAPNEIAGRLANAMPHLRYLQHEIWCKHSITDNQSLKIRGGESHEAGMAINLHSLLRSVSFNRSWIEPSGVLMKWTTIHRSARSRVILILIE